MPRVPVYMPKYGLTMEAGMIIEWKFNEGAKVAEGDILLTIETEKAVSDVVAPVAGTIVSRRFHAGDEVPSGTVLAYIYEG